MICWYGGVAGADATVGFSLGVSRLWFPVYKGQGRESQRASIYVFRGGGGLYYMRGLHREIATVKGKVV